LKQPVLFGNLKNG